jgi:hypothetical protein
MMLIKKPLVESNFEASFRTIQNAVHTNAKEHGWWEEERNDGELIALMHSELSECLEALRKGDHADEHCPDFTNAEIELADVIIRIMDMAERRGYRIGKAVIAKHKYNRTRPFKHGGKKF